MTGADHNSPVAIERHGAVQLLRLNRPDKKNALTSEMYRMLSDALQSGDKDETVAVHVFLGSGGNFCSGNDIADFLATAKGAGGLGDEVLRFIHLLPVVEKPMLAGVNGHAVGIGTTLLFHCDHVVAASNAKFSTPFLNLGLVPEAASSLLMPQTMGYHRAFEMLVMGSVFSAVRAEAAGFVNAIVTDENLEAEVLSRAAALSAKPRQALAMARALMRGDQDAVLARTSQEAKAFRERLGSSEAREAFQAFMEKRPPDFNKPPTKG